MMIKKTEARGIAKEESLRSCFVPFPGATPSNRKTIQLPPQSHLSFLVNQKPEVGTFSMFSLSLSEELFSHPSRDDLKGK